MNKKLDSKYYTSSEIKKLFHVTTATLWRWRKEGKIHAIQPTIRKFLYPKDEIGRLLGLQIQEETQQEKKAVLYCRVSTHAQKPHLERQKQLLCDFCTANGIVVDEVISEIASGMNDQRKQFLRLVDMVLRGEVKTVVVSYKDRLTRFGFDFYKWLFEKNGCQILIVNNPIDQEMTEKEMTDDLVSIIHHFSMKMYSARRKQLKKCREALEEGIGNEEQENPEGKGNDKLILSRKTKRPDARGD